ncbi:hypothetical protein A2709_01320 [candidate division WWE3 bacterium RIFCSPHIGHO2_01_FULL_43_9]|uniref:HTH merR-type domain-containing protein n=1 Tax=candidate division WWE3 bacterium RIFCSPHIGHO2_01_FULL_43_9 TaxID=1802618 RepID=A0A1F4V284_UNCKA|nr:MAG: hypothetical protein A2709_01320 [candidate division WWE3 bacterium RIFCSPHIGHO2_01_FULL_43_9]
MEDQKRDLMSIENLIQSAIKKGVDFGKGDPYNRLRYYTKIGLLPHMQRKTVNGELIGHYPNYALDLLVEVEKLKSLGFSNQEVSQKIKSADAGAKSMSKASIFKLLRIATPSPRIIKGAIFVLFCLMLFAGLGILPIGKTKNDLIQKTIELDRKYILDSGTSIVQKNQSRVYVKSQSVKSNSKITVTFTADYTPAARYWVAQRTSYEGFYLELDAPVGTDVEFNWWVAN